MTIRLHGATQRLKNFGEVKREELGSARQVAENTPTDYVFNVLTAEIGRGRIFDVECWISEKLVVRQ